MMNPFKALGDLNEMRKHASVIQSQLEAEEYEVIYRNVKVVITGNQHVKKIEIDGVQNEDVNHAINDAIKKSQQAAAMKLAQMTQGMQ
jgi:DNA-binding protein YbaB